mmetsp:Transcript_26036/g.51073  ORF Transcript_26036/g.51073 Transcript_26036/m.51073 type:complete len:93 (+) Transcript_26036:1281-1559(+)
MLDRQTDKQRGGDDDAGREIISIDAAEAYFPPSFLPSFLLSFLPSLVLVLSQLPFLLYPDCSLSSLSFVCCQIEKLIDQSTERWNEEPNNGI